MSHRSTVVHRGRSRGFTLIELLVVLAIVATLTMLVLPKYYSQIDKSKEAVLRENLRVTRGVIDKFYGDLGRYPESLEELVEKRYLRSLPMDPVTESSQTWRLIEVPMGYRGRVYDLRSGATGVSRDGRAWVEF